MKRITSLLVTLLLLVGTTNLFAVSEAGVLFLLISPTARAGGMGEAFGAVADDASATYFNPGGLAFQEGLRIFQCQVKAQDRRAGKSSLTHLRIVAGAWRAFFQTAAIGLRAGRGKR